ncbi:hypothetical protein LWI28_019112 [Acer negundo]|uniref:Uncharacterized protein n=1 Tax=Acer negundo TaxID=4023 RepID=A0AAD5JQS2_ACENE|nr:hypothetical protein LWI28_019112 [Acer negundo]
MGSRIARPRFSLLGFQRDVGRAMAGSEEATVEKMAPAMAVPIHEDMYNGHAMFQVSYGLLLYLPMGTMAIGGV